MRVTWLTLAISVLGAILVGCGASSAPSASSAQTSTTPAVEQSETSTTSTIPATTTTLDPEEQAWLKVPPFSAPGNGTARFRTSVFSAPLSFVPASDWTKQAETGSVVTLRSSADAPPAWLVFVTGFSSVADAVETYRHAADCFGATMTTPSGSIVGGAIGAEFEIVGLPQRTGGPCQAPLTDPTGTFVTGAWHANFRVVNINATAVTIIFWTTPGIYQDHLPSVDEMLRSVVWKVLR